MLLSIVIPVHNEADNVVPLVAELKGVLDQIGDAELIFVDDCSTDETDRRLLEARRRLLPTMRIVRHARRSGQSTALVTGARLASGTWLATLDGDGQNDPADLPRLLEVVTNPLRDPALRMVIGERATRRDTWLRRLSSRVANRVRGTLLGDGAPDTGCGLKLIDREMFLFFPYFDHMHRFLPALARREGAIVRSVPVAHRPRRAGRSHYGVSNRLWVGIVDMLGVIWLQRRNQRPVVPQEL